MSLTTKLGSIEAIFLIMIVTVNHIILNLPKAILETTSSASIINIVFITIIALLFVTLVCKLLKQFSRFRYFRHFRVSRWKTS